MNIKKTVVLITALCYLSGTSMAAAGRGSFLRRLKEREKEPPKPATFLDTAVHGTVMGAYTGLNAGWIRYYPDRHDTQQMWESAGYGAYAGVGLGLSAAIIGRNGTGDAVLSDIDRASGIGGGFGFLSGVVSGLFTGDSERVGTSLAWGHLAGFAIGMGYAGYKIAAKKYRPVEEKNSGGKTVIGVLKDSAFRDCPALFFKLRF